MRRGYGPGEVVTEHSTRLHVITSGLAGMAGAPSLTFSHLLLPSQVRGAWLPKRTRGGERVGGGEDGHGALARLRAGHAEALAAQHADLLVLSLGMAEWEA